MEDLKMKKFNLRNVLVAMLALSLLVCCFASCNNSGDSGDTEAADNSAKVTIEIYDEKGEIFLRGKDFAIAEGDTAKSIVEKLMTARKATCTFDATGMFESFKNEEGTEVKARTEMNSDGATATAYYFIWKYNSADMGTKAPADTVLKGGDAIEIRVQVDKNVTPKVD